MSMEEDVLSEDMSMVCWRREAERQRLRTIVDEFRQSNGAWESRLNSEGDRNFYRGFADGNRHRIGTEGPRTPFLRRGNWLAMAGRWPPTAYRGGLVRNALPPSSVSLYSVHTKSSEMDDRQTVITVIQS